MKAILTTYIRVAILRPTTAGRATVDLTLKQRKLKVTGNGPYKAVTSQSGITQTKYLSALKGSISRTIGQQGPKKADRKDCLRHCCKPIKNLLRTAYVSTSPGEIISADEIRHNKQQQNYSTRNSGITSPFSDKQTYSSNLHTLDINTRTAQGGQKLADRNTHKAGIYVTKNPALGKKNRKSVTERWSKKIGKQGRHKRVPICAGWSKRDWDISPTHIK